MNNEPKRVLPSNGLLSNPLRHVRVNVCILVFVISYVPNYCLNAMIFYISLSVSADYGLTLANRKENTTSTYGSGQQA